MIPALLVVAFVLSLAGLVWSLYCLKRNFEVHDFLITALNEEAEWLRDHPEFFQRSGEKFLRYESFPSYNVLLYKFWVDLKEYERPIYDFYRDLPTPADKI